MEKRWSICFVCVVVLFLELKYFDEKKKKNKWNDNQNVFESLKVLTKKENECKNKIYISCEYITIENVVCFKLKLSVKIKDNLKSIEYTNRYETLIIWYNWFNILIWLVLYHFYLFYMIVIILYNWFLRFDILYWSFCCLVFTHDTCIRDVFVYIYRYIYIYICVLGCCCCFVLFVLVLCWFNFF